MSSPASTTSTAVVPDSKHRESVSEFLRWALAQLDMDFSEVDGALQVQLAETDQASFAGQTTVSLSPDEATLDSQLGQWLLERLKTAGPAVPVRPTDQPSAVNDITQRLFNDYQVDEGRVHLGGCQLTDYPFLRLSFVSSQTGANDEVRHLYVAHDGSSVSEQLAHDLGLLNIEPVVQRPPRIEDAALQALVSAGRRVAAQTTTSRDPSATTIEPAAIAIVWVKHASGQLQFTIGDTTVNLPFSGWAKLLQAQPYTSPQSGGSGFHLAATDDGRIDVIEQIAVCQHSGQRVLQQELVTCSVTGKHVLEEFTETCPVTGKPALTDAFETCSSCQQRVSKITLESSTCTACQQLGKIKKDDPRLVWILGEHSGLDRWNHWQLSETQNVYITLASSWTKRLKVVVDKETLAVHHMATAGRLSSTWVPVDESARAELLR